jgi:hypothetical protein
MRMVNPDGPGQRPGEETAAKAARTPELGLVSFLGCVLLIGLLFPRRHAVRRRTGAPPAVQFAPQNAFETAFARAQQNYLHSQVVAKQQLEALEEWDGASINGSAPEQYRRSLIVSAREIDRAEAAARDAAAQATTDDEIYRATRLLLHVEHDMGRRAAELQLARKLVTLRPHNSQARLLLKYAAQDNEGLSLPQGRP